MGDIFRTPEQSARLEKYLIEKSVNGVCHLCTKDSLETFVHWRIVHNSFPYDKIAKTHEMIIPNRHVREEDLTQEELSELLMIKKSYIQKYDVIIEATHGKQSIPQHFHLHLIVGNKD